MISGHGAVVRGRDEMFGGKCPVHGFKNIIINVAECHILVLCLRGKPYSAPTARVQ